MKKLLFPVLIVATIVCLAAFFYFLYFLIHTEQRAVREMDRQISPSYPVFPLQVKYISNLFEERLPGAAWFSETNRVKDFFFAPGGLLIGTEGGLSYYSSDNMTRKAGRPTGLPCTAVFRLLEIGDRMAVLGKEGFTLLDPDFSRDFSGHGYFLESSKQADFVDGIVENEELYLLSSRGEVFRVRDRKAERLCDAAVGVATQLAKIGNGFYVGNTEGDLYRLTLSGAECRSNAVPGFQGAGAVRSMLVDDQALWIGADGGLFCLNDSGVSQVRQEAMVTDIASAGGQMLFGTFNGEVFDLNEPRPLAKFADPVYRIRISGADILAGTGGGIFRLRSDQKQPELLYQADKTQSLPENYISALAFDRDRLLVGGLNTGVWRVDPAARSVGALAPDLPGISAIRIDSSGKILVGATNGFVELDPDGKIGRRLTRDQGLIHNNVTDLLVHEKRVYLATAQGLSLMDQGSIRSIYAFHGLVSNHLYSLAWAADGIWVGTLGGLCRVGGLGGLAVEQCFTEKDGLTHLWVTALVNQKESLFVGTYGGGIMKLDPDRKLTLVKGSVKAVINLNAGTQAGETVCFGSLENGVFYSDTGNRMQTLTDGLPSTNVTALASDGRRLAVGTDAGLILFPIDLLKQEGWQ